MEFLPKRLEEYRVLVRCYTYNHSAYIKDALNGFVLQQTQFPFVIVLVDDASTDGEQDVIRQYLNEQFEVENENVACDTETTYARISYAQHRSNKNCFIAVYYLKENHYSQKKKKAPYIQPWRNICKYEAMCEGDDYWIDPLKLQKQVDFLDANLEYSFCCHRFDIYQQNSNTWLKEYADNFYEENENLEITIDLFFRTWVTQPLTVIYRTDCYQRIREKLVTYKYSRDVHFFYHLLKVGKGISLNQKMGVYRWHDGGVASSSSLIDKLCTAYNIYKELNLHTKDEKVLKCFVTAGVKLIKYRKCSNETKVYIKEIWHYSRSYKDKIRLIYSLMIPISFIKFLSFLRKVFRKRPKMTSCSE